MLPAAALLLVTLGCSCHMNLPAPIGLIKTEASMALNGHEFDLRLSKPAQAAAGDVLIIYATGDGGWLGLGGDVFQWLASWNYPIAGFSSRGYIHNLGLSSDAETTTPRRLVRDYENIIAFAETRLGLPSSTPIILVGLSRGAGFAVVAAGEGGLDQRLAGLLAIALTKEEEHVMRNRPRNARSVNNPRQRPQVMIETYTYLSRIGSLPLMVLQSTNDGYLPADAARKLFGADTDLRKLRAVEASNHSFSGGCQTLYQDTQDALKWMTGLIAARRAK
jgi:fermentation-respiration switch protein FrsA (DUF1100 family)